MANVAVLPGNTTVAAGVLSEGMTGQMTASEVSSISVDTKAVVGI
jgi:hypothetical protein